MRQEFAAVVAEEPGEPGAHLAAYVNGRLVVDLWAGAGMNGPSLTGGFSSAKDAGYLVVALLVQDGVLALDQTGAHYCPEFAAQGKADITLRELLTHRARVIGVDGLSPRPKLCSTVVNPSMKVNRETESLVAV